MAWCPHEARIGPARPEQAQIGHWVSRNPTASDPDRPVNPLRPRLQAIQREGRWREQNSTAEIQKVSRWSSPPSPASTSSETGSNRRGTAGRKRMPTPRSPSDAASKTRVGQTSSIGGLAVRQPHDQKMEHTYILFDSLLSNIIWVKGAFHFFGLSRFHALSRRLGSVSQGLQ